MLVTHSVNTETTVSITQQIKVYQQLSKIALYSVTHFNVS